MQLLKQGLVIAGVVALFAGAAWAQSAPPTPVVKGLYIDAKVGGGTMVLQQDIGNEPGFEALQGKPEGLGAGAALQVGLGYDVTEALALEWVSGMTLVAGGRVDRARDLEMLYSGLGLRLVYAFTKRFYGGVNASAGYLRTNNAVDQPVGGLGGTAGLGFEYYVRVRHFSVGLDAMATAAVEPQRVFFGLMPRLKYTF